MSIKVNIHEAKTYFSRLLAKVGNGEEIVIAKAGKPIARLVPILERSRQSVAGSAKGKVFIKSDFDIPLPEPVLKAFEQ